MNLLDIWGLWSTNPLDIWGIWSRISLIFGTYEGQISRTFMNLLNIWSLWSMNLLDSWGLWSTNLLDSWGIWSATLQDICKSPGYSGPMKCWMFWACIIKCCQSAKDKLFLDWQPLKSMHPYVLFRDQYQNQRVKNLGHSLSEFSLLELL